MEWNHPKMWKIQRIGAQLSQVVRHWLPDKDRWQVWNSCRSQPYSLSTEDRVSAERYLRPMAQNRHRWAAKAASAAPPSKHEQSDPDSFDSASGSSSSHSRDSDSSPGSSSSEMEGKQERKRTGEGQAVTSSHKSCPTATASSKLSRTVGSRSERQRTGSPRGSRSGRPTADHYRPPSQLAQGTSGPRHNSRKQHMSRSTSVPSSTSPPRAFPGAHSPVPVGTSTPIQDPSPLAPGALPDDPAEEEIPTEPPLEDSTPADMLSIPLGLMAQRIQQVEEERIQAAVTRVPLDLGVFAPILRVQFVVEYFQQPDPCLNPGQFRFGSPTLGGLPVSQSQ